MRNWSAEGNAKASEVEQRNDYMDWESSKVLTSSRYFLAAFILNIDPICAFSPFFIVI